MYRVYYRQRKFNHNASLIYAMQLLEAFVATKPGLAAAYVNAVAQRVEERVDVRLASKVEPRAHMPSHALDLHKGITQYFNKADESEPKLSIKQPCQYMIQASRGLVANARLAYPDSLGHRRVEPMHSFQLAQDLGALGVVLARYRQVQQDLNQRWDTEQFIPSTQPITNQTNRGKTPP
jgi:hypothetical protein